MTADGVEGELQYSGIRLPYSYNRSARVLKVKDQTIAFEGDKNTALIDGADAAGKLSVVGVSRLVGRYDSPATPLAPTLRAAPDVVAFLQCDQKSSQIAIRGRGVLSLCDELKP
ncbi:MAG TPA: hypothetical protein VJP86_05710 [Vicinamibacterales bacterium]|jgi:hypothetical protein|nr:hypothetical protein [Vicinamibacterales bacterium]